MAIVLLDLNLIVPIATLERKYAGGWERFVRDHDSLNHVEMWHDDHLLRAGTREPMALAFLLEDWREQGLRPQGRQHGQAIWLDCCVVEAGADTPTLPCDWISIGGGDAPCAWLRDQPPGLVVGPDLIPT